MFHIFSYFLMALDRKIIWRKPIFMKILELNMQSVVDDPSYTDTEWEPQEGEREVGVWTFKRSLGDCDVQPWLAGEPQTQGLPAALHLHGNRGRSRH